MFKEQLAFLRNYVGDMTIVFLLVIAVEKILEAEFVCPCHPIKNKVISSLIGIVPGLIFGIFTFMFVKVSASGKANDDSRNIFNDIHKTKKVRSLYAMLAMCIWLAVFFCDGRFVACGASYWTGIYSKSTDNMMFKAWCKPYNETTEEEKKKETTEHIFYSQVTGFVILAVTVLGTAIVLIKNYKEDKEKNEILTTTEHTETTDGRGQKMYTNKKTQINYTREPPMSSREETDNQAATEEQAQGIPLMERNQ